MAEENCTRPETVAGIDLAPSILVVEDDRGLNLLIQKNLIKAGYRTAGAFSGAEALGAAGGMGDVLLLLDYKLPDMTGEELIRKLGAAGAAVPFIVMTGYGDEKTAVAMMKLGALEYVIKDAGFLDLLPHLVTRAVDDLMSRRRLARAEERIHKLNRVYAVLSNINQAIVRIHEPATLFKEICRIAVEEGGFRMAWIGMADSATGNVNPVASAGATGDYLEKVHIVLGDEARGNCPAGSALKAGGHFVCNDVENGPCMTSWREEAIRMGFRSSVAFPLTVSGQVRGVFTLYAAERAFFDEEELKLLDELAMDVSFAMEFTEKEAERKKAEEQRERTLLQQQGVTVLQQSLLAPASLQQKLKSITDGIVRIFNADFCRIWLIRPGDLCEQGCIHVQVQEGPHVCRYRDRCLHLFSSSGRYTHIDGKAHRRVPFGCYKIGRVASGEDHKFITNDVQNDPRVHNREWARGLGLVSFAGYQLRVPGGQTMGVLALFAGRPITSEEDAMLDGLSSTVAFVVQQTEGEMSLRQSEEKFRNYIEHAPDGVFIVNDTGRYIEANKAACRITGFSKEEIVKMSIRDLVADESLEDGLVHFKKLMETGAATSDLWHKHKDGPERCLTVNAVKLSETRILGFCKDITDRKRVEESLRESEARYRALFDASAEGILIADLETKIFEYANPAICRMLGYAENELRTMSVADIHPKDALQSVVAEFEAQARGDKILAEGLPCLSKDGTILYADINAVKIIINGKACNAGFFRDITERKQAEENRKKLEDQLRQSQKMEAIGQLASGISHDFNNLLGGIMGHAELLKIRLGAGSGLLDHADRIISCCVKASDLTRQLLSFARKAPALVRAVDPNAIIRQVVEILKRTMDRRIEIAIDLEEQPPHISGDQSQLENALLNVAINARDAMPQGGRLSITSKTVDLDQAILPDEHFDIMEGRYIRISIADTGIGMSDEIKARIFEPFFTTKEVGKGTGLGLASVYGCIKQHGGYITVESREGEGARFDLYLPVAESAQPAAATEDAALAPGKGTLLVVDDEVVYHEVLSGIFKGLGYTVHCCIEGAEAVKFYSEHHASVDIVVLDMNMPKMNGLDCFRRLKEINAGVRVIVSSGYGYNADRTALQNEGARAFVQKPYKAAELAGKIVELMGSQVPDLKN